MRVWEKEKIFKDLGEEVRRAWAERKGIQDTDAAASQQKGRNIFILVLSKAAPHYWDTDLDNMTESW